VFERFTQQARRAIYFANRAARRFGSRTIDTDHLLLGLIREDESIPGRFMQPQFVGADIRKEVERRMIKQKSASSEKHTALSMECARVLHYAAEEAELLNHPNIGTEHLLLGLLRESNSGVSEILRVCGLDEGTIRRQIAGGGTDEPGE
jgi:ATP-dependent Clp protease ATP-binding subunit ClpC